MGDYRMPSLGADMDAGKVAKWLIHPGDHVHRGDIVAEIETEKALIDAEIFENGVVEALLVEEGELVPVGTPLARLTAEGAAVAPAKPRRERRAAKPRRVTVGEILAPSVPAAAPTTALPEAVTPAERRGLRASPMARRRARELGVDLAAVAGSGPSGAIVVADVERARTEVAPPEEAPAATNAAPPAEMAAGAAEVPQATRDAQAAAMRRAIGALMARSKREIPHYYLETTIDFGAADAWLRQTNLDRPPRLRVLSAALLLKATALVAKETPEMNGFYVQDEFHPSSGVHLGVAISLRQGGLIAPAIHDVDTLGIDELTAQLKDLVARTRSGRLRSSEMADPSLTVTNLGEQGVEKVFGVIYPPQVALVGFGKIVQRLYVVDGLIGVRPLIVATLSADHRVSDGATGARFLAKIDRLLQHPEEL